MCVSVCVCVWGGGGRRIIVKKLRWEPVFISYGLLNFVLKLALYYYVRRVGIRRK